MMAVPCTHARARGWHGWLTRKKPRSSVSTRVGDWQESPSLFFVPLGGTAGLSCQARAARQPAFSARRLRGEDGNHGSLELLWTGWAVKCLGSVGFWLHYRTVGVWTLTRELDRSIRSQSNPNSLQ
ncbi:hypothetical protein CPAR01_14184 [Colletotrichum paranaense]|uniref:Uncharacterized protein n=1 Tax=Colletotrichum paranaense TaxID=1914294 RepID=A0ABQ9S3E3_9PEZI|nr:uncharacterized protein CPAR01_14184 [Colletotrichum paranaense]KAK1523331.1 hypothetical protein CPAR01_14184 [Colletotrichum paranaense]